MSDVMERGVRRKVRTASNLATVGTKFSSNLKRVRDEAVVDMGMGAG